VSEVFRLTHPDAGSFGPEVAISLVVEPRGGGMVGPEDGGPADGAPGRPMVSGCSASAHAAHAPWPLVFVALALVLYRKRR
jgi:uncharacterized protein (TIGR03382 family)